MPLHADSVILSGIRFPPSRHGFLRLVIMPKDVLRHPSLSTPAARLSDDILHMIFLHLVLGHDPRPDLRPLNTQNLSNGTTWLSVTYVCQFWRNVALASPRLWSRWIVDKDCCMPMLREFISRSGNLAVHVAFEGPASASMCQLLEQAQLVADCSHRLLALVIRNFHEKDTTSLANVFSQPGPILRKLVLTATNTAQPGLIGSVFADEMPALRSLVSSHNVLPWYPYRNMTELVLMNQSAPPLSQLKVMLRRCPAIHSLCLGFGHSHFPPDPLDTPRDNEVIHLPNLRQQFVLRGMSNVVGDILAQISFPKVTRVMLKLHAPRVNSSSYRPSMHTFESEWKCADLLARTSGVGIDDIALFSEGLTSVSVSMISWYWCTRPNFQWISQRLRTMADSITFPRLVRLTIKEQSIALSDSAWCHILRAFPALTTIDLNADVTLGFLRALSKTTHNQQGVTFDVCPLLSTVILSTPFEGDKEATNETLRRLTYSFRKRAANGARLKLLRVAFANLREEEPGFTDMFSELADQVEIHVMQGPLAPPPSPASQ
ncbi:uncharacterized protein LAESUDRAFT_810377, partial [Laetiporus sulphureus 93-53]